MANETYPEPGKPNGLARRPVLTLPGKAPNGAAEAKAAPEKRPAREPYQAGRPAQNFKPKNSFGEWSDAVRAPLVWLGREDPDSNAEAARNGDPERQMLAEFLPALRLVAGRPQDAISTAKIIELAAKRHGYNSDIVANPEFDALVQSRLSANGRPSRERVGRWLAQHKGRVVGAQISGAHTRFRLALAIDSHTKKSGWHVEDVEAPPKTEYEESPAGVAGVAGVPYSPSRVKTHFSSVFLNGEGCNKDSNNENTHEKCVIGEEGRGTSPATPATPAGLSNYPLSGVAEADEAYDAPFVD